MDWEEKPTAGWKDVLYLCPPRFFRAERCRIREIEALNSVYTLNIFQQHLEHVSYAFRYGPRSHKGSDHVIAAFVQMSVTCDQVVDSSLPCRFSETWFFVDSF